MKHLDEMALDDLMSGKTEWRDARDHIKTHARLHFVDAARQICAAQDVNARRKMLSKIPENVRPEVQSLVKAMWEKPNPNGNHIKRGTIIFATWGDAEGIEEAQSLVRNRGYRGKSVAVYVFCGMVLVQAMRDLK